MLIYVYAAPRRDGGEMEKKSKIYAPLTGRERTRRAVLTVLAGGAVNLILFFVKSSRTQ